MAVPELVAEAERLLAGGRPGDAIAVCREALALEPDCLPAHVCMARAKLPGEDYLAYLRRFHETLAPRVYLEIGVDAGRTLSLAKPPTRAFGVDPAARETRTFPAPTRLFPVESDAFFASGAAAEALAGAPVDLAFVDGLHLFEQALRDFAHVERHAAPGAVVLFHDCLPLDAATATRERRTGFWTGDVWKIIPILQRLRPDLTVFLIPAYPTGLLVVTRLDPKSRVLEKDFDALVAEWIPKKWSGGPDDPPLPLVPNDWPGVLARIRPAV
jgi:Methyltransferase domain